MSFSPAPWLPSTGPLSREHVPDQEPAAGSESRRNDSLAFFHGKEAVDGGDGDFFLCPAWPENLHPVYFACRPKAEVQALIGTRCIASPAEDVPALPHASGGDKDLGSDRVARAFRAPH